jgi:hypothetical protein
MPEKPSVTVSGTVQKVLQFPSKPEKAQIAIEGPDHVHKEIRIENSLTDESGQEVELKTGDKVKVTIKAAPESIGL